MCNIIFIFNLNLTKKYENNPKQSKTIQKFLLGALLLAVSVTGFYACKKNVDTSDASLYKPALSVKSESKIIDLSQEFKKTNILAFIKDDVGLDLESGTISKINETDSIEFYTFKYKNLEKVLIICNFKYLNQVVPLNIEHKKDIVNKGKEEILLSDYKGTLISVETYENKKFKGFASKSKISSSSGKFGSLVPNTMVVAESCYECINRNYQESVKKCSDDMLCDITCSLNVSCKILFAVSALAVCTSPSSRPCSPLNNSAE